MPTLRERFITFAQNTPLLKRCAPPIRPENRTVIIGNKQAKQSDPDITFETFCSNKVVTTKYTPWNFIFKNLFEQFMRIANTYFLIVAIIQLFIPDSPVSPLTSIIPLIFVLLVTAVKQAYEDWLRSKEDNSINNKLCQLVEDSKITEIPSQNIKVGDILKITDNQAFPCDLVLLSSSEEDGICSVTTANLDGETNLKTFASIAETKSFSTIEKLSSLRGQIECQQPITDLYRFLGNMTVYSSRDDNSTTKALQAQNVLLRGAKLKNTDFIYGCVIYTGQETKLALNSRQKSIKRSRVERTLNMFLIVYLLMLLAQCITGTIIRYAYWINPNRTTSQWYIPLDYEYRVSDLDSHDISDNPTEIRPLRGLLDFLYFYVIFNYIIPISLYVTIELQKFVGSMFFKFDAEMYDDSIDEPAKANTSDLNEELGQIDYLFCDKTGTLTENVMQFRQCSINGLLLIEEHGKFVPYTGEQLSSSRHDLDQVDSTMMKLPSMNESRPFFEVLSLCHTIQIEEIDSETIQVSEMESNGHGSVDAVDGRNKTKESSLAGDNYEYHASSPDEKALVEACRRFGYVYHGQTDNLMKVTELGDSHQFKVHQVLEFDSTRKCMSTITETEQGVCKVLCKGAESAVLKKCTSGPIDVTYQHVDHFASLGLRTLVIAEKIIDRNTLKEYNNLIEMAKQDLTNRDEALIRAYEEIESNLTALGATAIEDRLQDGVKETIESLRAAGIKVWILTGDKEETAVNISHSAGHIDNSMRLFGFTLQPNETDAYQNLLNIRDGILALPDNKGIALVVDGSSLSLIMKRHEEELKNVCLCCHAVVCCRMTPLQKAEIVRMVKQSPSNPTTAAIGDGANDVSMIQEAHLGLGIMGKEGRQATRSSDYAFGKFRFLLRALLVHGQYYYHRIAILVQYFFYKNIAFITANFYYMFFNGYSGASVFDSIYLLFYNITFTSLPIFLFGLFEQHIPQDILLSNPAIYQKIRNNKEMNIPNFIKWNILGFYHSIVAYFGVYLVYTSGSEITANGQTTDSYTYGSIIIFICMTTVNCKLMLETYYFTWFTLAGYLITFIGNWAMVAVYCAFFWPDSFTLDKSMFGVLGQMFQSITFWLLVILCLVISLLPDFLVRVYRDLTDPHYQSISQHRSELDRNHSVHFSNSHDSVQIKSVRFKTNDEFNMHGPSLGVTNHGLELDETNTASINPKHQQSYINHALQSDL